MKKVLFLSFYFEPDLCAGSFRNSPLALELTNQSKGIAEIDVITTLPNRYNAFNVEAPIYEIRENCKIYRILIPKHRSGMIDQVFSFKRYFNQVKELTKKNKYDLVFASSSRLFTAYLGYKIAKSQKIPLYLDIRDIFADTMQDVLQSKILKAFLIPLLNQIENLVFSYATHINLISGGFINYFLKYQKANFSVFSNGIDDIFFNQPNLSYHTKPYKLITYAGNFGEGQGLHKIVPQSAKMLGKGYKFLLIGDGGSSDKLLIEIEKQGIDNVEICPPIKREELLKIYSESDFLFIHLNDYKAFEKVLPSKIFELAAFDKPIIAGVAGYAKDFIEENITNKILFKPSDPDDLVTKVKEYSYKLEDRLDFKNNYKRKNINEKMARSILAYI